MSIEIKEQEYPKWFKGERYAEGATVENRFSGEKYELNRIELSIYDFIIGSSLALEMGIFKGESSHVVKEMHDGLDWFRKNNLKAYMVLLD